MNITTPKKKPKSVVPIEEHQILWNMVANEMRGVLNDVRQFNNELRKDVDALRQLRANEIPFPKKPR